MDSVITQIFDIFRWVVFTTLPIYENRRRHLIKTTPKDLQCLRIITKQILSWVCVITLISTIVRGKSDEMLSFQSPIEAVKSTNFRMYLIFFTMLLYSSIVFRIILLKGLRRALQIGRQRDYILYFNSFLWIYFILVVLSRPLFGDALIRETYKYHLFAAFNLFFLICTIVVPYVTLSLSFVPIRPGHLRYVSYIAISIPGQVIVFFGAGYAEQLVGVL